MQIPEPQGITSTSSVGRIAGQSGQQLLRVELSGGRGSLQSGTTVTGQVVSNNAQGTVIQTADGQTLQTPSSNLAVGQNVAVRFLNSGRQAQAEVFALATDAQLSARFSVGDQARGVVLGRLQGGGLLTQIGSTFVEANGPNSLRLGDVLNLRVDRLTPNAQFSIQTSKGQSDPNSQVLSLLRSNPQQPAPLHQALGRIANLANALAQGNAATTGANQGTTETAQTPGGPQQSAAVQSSASANGGQPTTANSPQLPATSAGESQAAANLPPASSAATQANGQVGNPQSGQPLGTNTAAQVATNSALNDGSATTRTNSTPINDGKAANVNQPAAHTQGQDPIANVLLRLDQLLQQLRPQEQGQLASQFLNRLEPQAQQAEGAAVPSQAQAPHEQRTENVVQEIRTLISENLSRVESSSHPQAEVLAEGMRDVMHQTEIELLLNLLARGSNEPYRFELPVLGHQPTTVFLAIDPEATPEQQQAVEQKEKRVRVLLSLDLPELGKVRIALSLTASRADVGLYVEEPATRGILESQLNQLTGRLTDLGFEETNLKTHKLSELSNPERSQFELMQARYPMTHNAVDTVG